MTTTATPDYRAFLRAKSQCADGYGFEPLWVPDFLFDFQRALVEWAIRRGRAAIFADCGMGKTVLYLVWAENVARFTNGRVLIVAPLSVVAQVVREAEKFGLAAHASYDGTVPEGARLVATNYEQLHKFAPADFAGAVCDESSILKNFAGKRKAEITEFLRTLAYRLLCSATAAPNDYVELGTHSEALGEMGHQDMLSRFFKNDKNTNQVQRLYCEEAKWRFRGHAEGPFWRWVCSWARAIRRPSDMGFEDGKFVLPKLDLREHVVAAKTQRDDVLFDPQATTLEEQQAERRRTIPERCAKVAELVKGRDLSIAWCHLNDEADLLEELIPNSRQVGGTTSAAERERTIDWFFGRTCVCKPPVKKCRCGHASGKRVLISKPTVFGFGLNLQCCAHMTFFPSHSFEQYYQAVRRCWRFGQKRRVVVDVVTSEGEAGVLANLRRKAEQADTMFAKLVELMNDSLAIEKHNPFVNRMEAPSWL